MVDKAIKDQFNSIANDLMDAIEAPADITDSFTEHVGLHIVDSEGFEWDVLDVNFSVGGNDFHCQSVDRDEDGKFHIADFSTRWNKPGLLVADKDESVTGKVFEGFSGRPKKLWKRKE